MAAPEVLVADDEAVSQRLVCAMLDQAGYPFRVVEDGIEALELLMSDAAPPIALLDWIMPRLDGIEVIRRLREQSQAAQPYVILLTSRRSPHDIVAGLKAGADDYITKPPHLEELVARVSVGARVVGCSGR
ncbi:MAG: response regulator [Vicinamibacterales bacterium]